MIADMAIEIYGAESALLRTLKCLSSAAGDPDGFRLDVTRAWCRALPEKIERLGASTLAAAVEGDALTTPLAALKKAHPRHPSQHGGDATPGRRHHDRRRTLPPLSDRQQAACSEELHAACPI
jgi:hypothetical protein